MSLKDRYLEIQNRARRLAGEPGDIARRVAVHYSLYQDSRGNHAFPLVALHGALWAYGFFESTGKLGRIIQYRYFYNARERKFRMGLLNGFSQGFKSVNRSVFIDTYTNYFFTKECGGSGVSEFVRPELADALDRVHHAARNGASLSDSEKKHVFLQSLRWEQEITVGPGVKAEVEKFHCPILTFLCLKPVVRFAYFPRWKFLFFNNFSNTDERIENARRSFELARLRGWDKVERSMKDYRVLPEPFFQSPSDYVKGLTESA